MNSSVATLERLLQPASSDGGIDRKALAGLLVELARNLDSSVAAQPTGVAPFDPRLEQLRRLLLGREIELIERLSRTLDDPDQLAGAVSEILPAAIARAAADPAGLGEALTPVVEKAAEASVRRNPRALVNILYPVIVPGIRKSIVETIDETFQSLNESLKHSLSLRGLKWRWEAWRTGTSFAEVVLRHTLVYRIEHVFLIHGRTGLLIAHSAAKDATAQDPQLVSSMLTAIQDFVRDSFTGAERDGLDAIRFGDLRLWSEQGPSATLVAVIRGNPPESLHETFRNALSEIHARHHVALEAFNGDGSEFSGLEEQLAQCAGLAQSAPEAPVARHGSLLVLLVVATLAALLATWAYRSWRAERLWEGYLARLRAEPGIVVMENGERDGRWQVGGLRDPLAADPAQILRQSSIDPARVDSRWQPFQALDLQFIVQRLQAALDPPRSITLAVEGDRIVVGGSAPVTWVRHARASISALAISPFRVDLTQVRELDDAEFVALRDAIQSKVIRFDVNESTPAQGQDQILDDVAQELQQLEARSATLHVPVRLMLTGHSDVTGKGTANLSISLARAETVRALLRKRGVDPDLLAVRAAGALEPLSEGESESARSIDRRVSFSVEFE